jgi:hypothetical protein
MPPSPMNFSDFPYQIQDAIVCWFNDPCCDLQDLGQTTEQREFLAKIEAITTQTGATNFDMAKYFLDLEERLLKLENHALNP